MPSGSCRQPGNGSIKAMTLATYTPERDRDERTLRLGLRLIQILGECMT
jgi:hypothetical protein